MKEKVLEKLKEIKDPEIGIDIVSLGMVKDVRINDVIEIDFLPTSIFCPYLSLMLSEISEKLKEEFKKDVKINIVLE